MTSIRRNTESADAQIALLASVDRMRYRKGARPTMIGVGAIRQRQLSFREQRNKMPYRRKEHSSSQSKRAVNPIARQKDDRAAVFPASRSTSPSSSCSSAPNTPSQETMPYLWRLFSEPTEACMHTRSCKDIGERGIGTNRNSKKPQIDEEIVREMFEKYTNFDTWNA